MTLLGWLNGAAKGFKWWMGSPDGQKVAREASACEQARAYVSRGWAYYLEEEYGLAKDDLLAARALLERSKNDRFARLLLGRVYLVLGHLQYNSGNYKEAAEQYGKTIEHAPSHEDLEKNLSYYHCYLGRSYSQAKDRAPEDAFREFEAATPDGLDSDRRGAFFTELASACVDLYTTLPAEAAPEKADLRGRILDKAQQACSEALFLKPGDAQRINDLGVVYYHRVSLVEPNDKQEARAEAEKARQRFERALKEAAEPGLKGGFYRNLAYANALLARLNETGQSQYYEDAVTNFESAMAWAADAKTSTDLAAEYLNLRVTVYSEQAGLYLQASHYEEAIESYTRAVELAREAGNNLPFYLNLLGFAYMQKPDLDQATLCFQEAIREQGAKQDPVFYWNLGNAQYQNGRYTEAATAWEQAVKLDNENTEYLNWLGNAYYKIGNLEHAADAYRQAADKPADNEKKQGYLRNLGNVELELKRPADAVQAYTQLVQIDDGNWNSHYLLGLAYRRSNNFEKAEENYKRALALTPEGTSRERINVCRNLGLLYQAFRYFEDAVPVLESVRDQDPKDVDVRLSLAESYANTGKAREALSQLREASEVAPADTRIGQAVLDDYKTLGEAAREDLDWEMAVSEVSYARGDYETAVAADKQLLRLAPADPRYRVRPGQSLLRAGAYRKAIEALLDAVKVDPESDVVHFELGEAFAQQGNYLTRAEARREQYGKAAAEFRRAIQRKSDNATYHNRLGMCCLQLGNGEEAARELAAAVRLRPEDLGFRTAWTACLVDQGRYAEALQVLEQTPTPSEAPADLLDLANAYALNDRYADAVKVAERINVADATAKPLYDQLATTLRNLAEEAGIAARHAAFADASVKLNSFAIAVAEYRKALALDEANADYHKQLGNALWKRNDFKGAATEWEKTIQTRPDDALTINNLGTAYDALEKYEEAMVQYKRAVELSPGNFVPFFNLGTANYRLKQVPEALQAFRESASRKNDFARTHYNIGNCQFRLGQMEGAKQAWQKAVEIDKLLAEAQFNLGVAFWTSGDKDSAVQKWRDALQADRNMSAAEDNLEAASTGGSLDLEIRDLIRDK